MFGAALFVELAQETTVMDPVNVFNFAALVKKRLDPVAWDYLWDDNDHSKKLVSSKKNNVRAIFPSLTHAHNDTYIKRLQL